MESTINETVKTESVKAGSTHTAAAQKRLKKKALAENGQTFLDVSKGNIRITQNGAQGGGLSENETELNSKGYWITGTTSTYNVIVDKGVKTEITLTDVDISCNTTNMDCINVSHADVTITLIGKNRLYCDSSSTASGDATAGCALAKDGLDGNLVIQCEDAAVKGHRCDRACGSLSAVGNPKKYDINGIGSTLRNNSKDGEVGFANFTIKGGNIEASGGLHSCGIGVACITEHQSGGKGYAKDIRISGGIVKATGTDYGAGIGSGAGSKVDGVYITGGIVEARGGNNAPGIGASNSLNLDLYPGQTMITKNIRISGGDTVVKAIGDKNSSMPGIGSGAGNSCVSDVNAVPDFGYQGYIQDGTSETDYLFVDGTPFKNETAIQVGKYYTMVYFGPFRDANEIENGTKEQIGANHVISKTGGGAFSKSQLKGLSMVTGKDGNGEDFDTGELTFYDEGQINKINEAKTAGKTGEFELTFMTPSGTKATVTVFLKGDGTDAAGIDPENMEPTIGADGFWLDTGGEAFSEDDVRRLSKVQGKDKKGTTYPQEGFTADSAQLKVINGAKTSGKGGSFDLTFISPDGKRATVKVVLKVYDKTTVSEADGEQIKGLDIISRTGGEAFTKKQLIKLSNVRALNGDGDPIAEAELVFPEENQIQAINRAKTGGETGDFPLTIATPGGTRITIYVYLRTSGTDQAKSLNEEERAESLGANDTKQPTGGDAFSIEDITELCGAKGKDVYGNNMKVSVDKVQLEKINEAKRAGRTGEFKLTFSLGGDIKAEVTVVLTGDHKVSFDPNGGDFQPKEQIVTGGRPAVEPKEPKKKGFILEGWYYTDVNGKEVKWNFDTPVHQNMTLKAKWKKETVSAKTERTRAGETKTKDNDGTWNYREINKSYTGTKAAKTGDKNRIYWILGCMTGAMGIFSFFFYKIMKKGR